MKEFKQFSKKQLVQLFIGALIVVLLIVFGVRFMGELFASTSASRLAPETYQVLGKDSDGYWVAVKVVTSEDETFVPLSYYGKEDEVVVFLDENVRTELPLEGEVVEISMNAWGEEPIVITYD